MTAPFTFGDFRTVVIRVAEESKRLSIVEGINTHGKAYSLVDDTKAKNLDSLDVMETMMSLEEELLKLDGFAELKLEGKEVDDAENIGDLYLIICKQLGITPQMLAFAAA